MTFSIATGSAAVSFPSTTIRKIPVVARKGEASFFQGGCFVAPELGHYRFDVSCLITSASTNMKAYLLDDTLGVLSYLALSPTGVLVSGFDVLTLSAGQKVWLGAWHSNASTQTLTASIAEQYCKVLVTRL